MKQFTPTQLRADIYNLLDEVLETGIPLEIKRGDKLLRIVPVGKFDKFKNLIPHQGAIKGNPEDLVSIDWTDEVNLDLP